MSRATIPTDDAETYVGIDVGLDGAVSAYRSGRIVFAERMPTRRMAVPSGRTATVVDGLALAEMVGPLDPACIYLEECFTRHKKGAMNLGIAWGIPVDRLRDPCPIVVAAKTWQKQILSPWLPMVPWTDREGRPLDGRARNKLAAVLACRTLHPEVDLQPGRCSTPHDGIADSVCIAIFASIDHPNRLVGTVPGPRPRAVRRGARNSKGRRGA